MSNRYAKYLDTLSLFKIGSEKVAISGTYTIQFFLFLHIHATASKLPMAHVHGTMLINNYSGIVADGHAQPQNC
jgi:hypothetical protein